jgi:hypothetical protein
MQRPIMLRRGGQGRGGPELALGSGWLGHDAVADAVAVVDACRGREVARRGEILGLGAGRDGRKLEIPVALEACRLSVRSAVGMRGDNTADESGT